MVIHKTKHTNGARCNIQKLFHEIRCRKGKAGTSNLFGKLCCLKLLVPRHHEQIKLGLLGIAQEQIFADLDIQPDIHVMAGIDRGGGIVVKCGSPFPAVQNSFPGARCREPDRYRKNPRRCVQHRLVCCYQLCDPWGILLKICCNVGNDSCFWRVSRFKILLTLVSLYKN